MRFIFYLNDRQGRGYSTISMIMASFCTTACSSGTMLLYEHYGRQERGHFASSMIVCDKFILQTS